MTRLQDKSHDDDDDSYDHLDNKWVLSVLCCYGTQFPLFLKCKGWQTFFRVLTVKARECRAIILHNYLCFSMGNTKTF